MEVQAKIGEFVIEPPNVEHLITEDDTPVDNIFSEKQQRFLVDTLMSSHLFAERPFVASSNVGIYYGINKSAVVPDVFLSLDVSYPEDIWEKSHRVYMIWMLGKAPEVVIEIVSNTVGNETGRKFDIYAKMGVLYYIVLDPLCFINKNVLNVFELKVGEYYRKDNAFLEKVGLGVTLWRGSYEAMSEEWLRWTDEKGNILLSGVEKIAFTEQLLAKEQQNVLQERQRTEQERQRTEQERQRAERLAEKLKALGINPDEI